MKQINQMLVNRNKNPTQATNTTSQPADPKRPFLKKFYSKFI